MLDWKKAALVTIFVALAAVNVQAEDAKKREFADIYTECGLGAMIAPRNTAVAAVTNVTWDLGTTAISSNISSPGTCAGGKEKMASFIHESQDLLFSDLARGEGEYLDALVAIAGVDETAKNKFVLSVREESGRFVNSDNFANKSRFEKAQVLYDIVLDKLDANS